MLQQIRLVQEIGQFAHASAQNIDLQPLSLIYAENGRGKTTLVSVFRSLQSGDPLPISERRRLGALRPSHVALSFSDETAALVFQDGGWSGRKADIAIFDEQFVNDNIYSGLVVQSPQREGLHGLIVGAKGVALLRSLQAEVAAIETHNQRLRTLASAIPAKALRGLTIDHFCDLASVESVDERIEEARKAVSAAQQQESIRGIRDLVELPVAEIPAEGVEAMLSEQLDDIVVEAERRVGEHLPKLGSKGESWVAEGYQIQKEHQAELGDHCPYCAQSLEPSVVARAYSQHFSEAYNDLKNKIQRAIQRVHEIFSPLAADRLTSELSENGTKKLFWAEFIDVPELVLDSVGVISAAERARDAILGLLKEKADSPLERIGLSAEAREALAALSKKSQDIITYNQQVKEVNEKAAAVREAITVTSLRTLREELSRLEAAKDRHDPGISTKCEAYLAEKSAKKATESRRAARKRALDIHLQNVFPAFQDSINLYLRRLNAGFRIDGVRSLNTRRGPSCVYSVVIDNCPDHPVAVNEEAAGVPTFKTVLSTSDRSSLALAVFLASIANDDNRDEKIVVIDDPINSLDEHRSFATVTEIRRLAAEVRQVIVLSHSRPLVCHLWESPGQIGRVAIEVSRAGEGSELRIWDVSTQGVTEHDKRHGKLRNYVRNQDPDARQVAEAVRPTLEAFLRVAYPEHYPPGTLLGPFRQVCGQHVGAATEIVSRADLEELGALTEYANRFHHDTNPAWQTADINDAELLGFVRRTLSFAKRP